MPEANAPISSPLQDSVCWRCQTISPPRAFSSHSRSAMATAIDRQTRWTYGRGGLAVSVSQTTVEGPPVVIVGGRQYFAFFQWSRPSYVGEGGCYHVHQCEYCSKEYAPRFAPAGCDTNHRLVYRPRVC